MSLKLASPINAHGMENRALGEHLSCVQTQPSFKSDASPIDHSALGDRFEILKFALLMKSTQEQPRMPRTKM
jgi:hypothetical protein